MRGRQGALVVATAIITSVCGCGSEPSRPATPAGQPAGQPATGASTPGQAAGTVTVMAPAPLKGALDRVAVAFESSHPGLTVAVNYGHLPALLTQISQGVGADVIVTPDAATMAQVQSKGVAGAATVAVARNRLVLVVPVANPAGVKDVSALGEPALTVAVCAAELPCGKLTSELAARAGVTVAADSQEPGGSPAVVTKAGAGEIDLGVAFATDLTAANGKVTALPLDDTLGASATVTAAVLVSPANATAAGQFVSFLSSAEGKGLFAGAGFATL
jgi:molybdate transport system substrate-binding protein